jgi:hypothetical protein
MHFKNIKAIIRKQLKTNYRDWKRLKKREKREIAQKVLDEVLAEYDFKKEVETDKLESGVSTSLRSIVESKMGAVAHGPVSHPRSSNRACGSPAHGFPTDFASRHTLGGCFHRSWQKNTKLTKYLF